MPQTSFYQINHTGKLNPLQSVEEALSANKNGGFIWLNYYDPTAAELGKLVEPLGLHPLAIEDCLDEDQIPKVEDFPDHTFVLFNAFQYEAKAFSVHEIDLIIGRKFLVTVSGKGEDPYEPLRNIERIVNQDIEDARQGPAYLAHVILDYVVDQQFLAIEALEEELNDYEDLILAGPEGFHPGDLMNLRRELLTLRKSLFHEREVLVKICRKDCTYIPEKSIIYYRDIYDHLAKFFELTESSREIVTSLMEMYLSMLNNQMAKSANDTNATVRRLTLITTIFMPLSLLAGIGGMSEWSMMTGPENWRVAYPLFLLAMVVIGVANYYLLRKFENRSDKSNRS